MFTEKQVAAAWQYISGIKDADRREYAIRYEEALRFSPNREPFPCDFGVPERSASRIRGKIFNLLNPVPL